MTDKMDVLPLSPARQCAMSYSRRLIRPILDHDRWRNFGSIDQRGYDADLLCDVFTRAAAAGGTVEIQRFDLFADDRGSLRRCGPRRHAQPDLEGILVHIERPAMRGCAAYQIDSNIGKCGLQALQDNFTRQPCPRQRVPSRIAHLALAD